jgi:hypothetical protein
MKKTPHVVQGSTRGVVARTDRLVPMPAYSIRKVQREVSGVSALALLKKQMDSTEREVRVQVRRARRAGVPWSAIGEALGVSQQSVSKKFGPYPPPKPGRVRSRVPASTSPKG